jgi:formate-dependent nitrite reductase membrane component NrfD
VAIASGGITVYLYLENVYKSSNVRLKRKLILFSFLALLISTFFFGWVNGHYIGYEKHKREVNGSVDK